MHDGGEAGYVGGLLVVNGFGRPLEFHCTAPFQPTPTQAILYGATLANFIYCEQLGGALIRHLKHHPLALVVQQPLLLELASQSSFPWLCLPSPTGLPSADGKAMPFATLRQWTIAEQRLIGCGNEAELDAAITYCRQFADRLPLDEPFERIRQALEMALGQAR